jgi:hypothetical protein
VDLHLYHPYRSLILSVVGALLLVLFTVRRQALGLELLIWGERVDSTVLSVSSVDYRVRTSQGEIVRVPKAGTLTEILTGREAGVGGHLTFYRLAGHPGTVRLVRFQPASTCVFIGSVGFLCLVPMAVVIGRRKAQRQRVIARV